MRMRTLVPILAALALLTFLPAPAAAQQQGSLVLQIAPPETIYPDTTITTVATATLTVDVTGMLSPSGIPVTYMVETVPAWATVTLSPASDVFTAPMMVPNGASYTVTRTFTITISVAHYPGDMIDLLRIAAITSPGFMGQSIYGAGEATLFYDGPNADEECDHGLTDAQVAALKAEAIDAYNEYNAAKDAESSDEVTVQNASASPVPLTSLAIAGFALVGAGVGLVLRKRLR